MHAGGEDVADAIEAEGAPVLALAIPGEQVPAARDGNEPVGLDDSS